MNLTKIYTYIKDLFIRGRLNDYTCIASETQILINDKSTKPIEDIIIGDEVITYDKQLNQTKTKINFAQGTSEDSYESVMVYLNCGDDIELITSRDQVFITTTGKYIRAANLIPHKDMLIATDGQPLEINDIKLGSYHGGVHHIATKLKDTEYVDGHLININGVIGGDYILQLYLDMIK